MTPLLVPLTCSACGGAVPLAPGEHATCPYCANAVEIPPAYRELRDAEQTIDADYREGHALATELARMPSAPVRMLAMFDTAVFLGLGLGFWLFAGVVVGVLLPPVIGRWFGVNTIDVLDERTQGALSIVVPFGTFALGLLGAGWARKRAIVRGGLQAVLAARPPERTGGPERCRQCGAALSVTAADHAVRCPYCGTDNLVNAPLPWIEAMRRHTTSLGREVEAAREAWTRGRRSLRTSLVWRGIIGALLVAVPATCVLAAGPAIDTAPIDHARGTPTRLPSWTEHRERSAPTRGFCSTPGVVAMTGFQLEAVDCDARGCSFERLVPLARGEAVRIVSASPPADSDVALQIHERRWLDDVWTDVATGRLDANPTLPATLSAWYRLAFRIPGGQPGQIVRACVELAE